MDVSLCACVCMCVYIYVHIYCTAARGCGHRCLSTHCGHKKKFKGIFKKNNLVGQRKMVEAVVPAMVHKISVVYFGSVAAVPLDIT